MKISMSWCRLQLCTSSPVLIYTQDQAATPSWLWHRTCLLRWFQKPNFFCDSMNLSYSTDILQHSAWRVWVAEQLVLMTLPPSMEERKKKGKENTEMREEEKSCLVLTGKSSCVYLLSSSALYPHRRWRWMSEKDRTIEFKTRRLPCWSYKRSCLSRSLWTQQSVTSISNGIQL